MEATEEKIYSALEKRIHDKTDAGGDVFCGDALDEAKDSIIQAYQLGKLHKYGELLAKYIGLSDLESKYTTSNKVIEIKEVKTYD